jgi:uncharacterized protein (UPF0264 family)
MTRLLVSVRDEDEALAAAQAGADFIDLKDPSAGALGALSPKRIARIVAVLRRRHPGRAISAVAQDAKSVGEVAACGVDYVKVGVESARALDMLAASAASVVPVLLADRGVDRGLVDRVLSMNAFAAVMLDTEDKRGGSLLQKVSARELAWFVWSVQGARRLAGVAGALRLADLPGVRALGVDFAGFRSAVCAGDRADALDPARVRDLHARL